MIDKETLEDYRKTIERLQQESTEKTNNIIALTQELQRKEQKCEKLKVKLMQKDEVNMFFNTPVDGWNDDPCKICPYKQDFQPLQVENEELKKDNKDWEEEVQRIKLIGSKGILEEKNKSDRYKQALERIKPIATDLRTRTNYRGTDEVNADIDKILTIINEVLKDE